MTPTPREALLLQLACIRGQEPANSYFELRPLTPDGRPAPRGRAFVPVRDIKRAIRLVFEMAPRLNVYVGAAPRVREDGTAASVARVWCLWTDLDGRPALERLRDFSPLPGIVVRSGSTDHAHAYWPLHKAVSPQGAERANRRLALALGGDPAATDAARILRPAGSLNHKHAPPAEVTCTRLETDMFALADVVGDLPDDPRYLPRPQAPFGHDASGDPSKVIAGLARVVRDAPTGNRNRATFWAACRVGEQADIDAELAVEEIRAAALASGLAEHEITATIRSGLAQTGARAA